MIYIQCAISRILHCDFLDGKHLKDGSKEHRFWPSISFFNIALWYQCWHFIIYFLSHVALIEHHIAQMESILKFLVNSKTSILRPKSSDVKIWWVKTLVRRSSGIDYRWSHWELRRVLSLGLKLSFKMFIRMRLPFENIPSSKYPTHYILTWNLQCICKFKTHW